MVKIVVFVLAASAIFAQASPGGLRSDPKNESGSDIDMEASVEVMVDEANVSEFETAVVRRESCDSCHHRCKACEPCKICLTDASKCKRYCYTTCAQKCGNCAHCANRGLQSASQIDAPRVTGISIPVAQIDEYNPNPDDVDLEALLFSLGDDNDTLSADGATDSEASRCNGRYMGAIESAAPGCLSQCYSRGICGAFSHAIGAYGSHKDKRAARKAACAHTGAFACLLERGHRGKCGVLIGQAGRFGIPTSKGSLYSRCR